MLRSMGLGASAPAAINSGSWVGVDPGIRNMGLAWGRWSLRQGGHLRVELGNSLVSDLTPCEADIPPAYKLAEYAGRWLWHFSENCTPAGATWYVELNSMPANPVNHVCTALFAACAAREGDKSLRCVAVNPRAVKKLVNRCLELSKDKDRPDPSPYMPQATYAGNKEKAQKACSWLAELPTTHHEADAVFTGLLGVLRDHAPVSSFTFISNSGRERTLACSPSEVEIIL